MLVTDYEQFLSIGEAAESLETQAWRIARLFELGLLPEPARIAGRRVIPASMLPDIEAALKGRPKH